MPVTVYNRFTRIACYLALPFQFSTRSSFAVRFHFLRSKKFANTTENATSQEMIVSRKSHFLGWDRNFCSSLTGKINFLLEMLLLNDSPRVKGALLLKAASIETNQVSVTGTLMTPKI